MHESKQACKVLEKRAAPKRETACLLKRETFLALHLPAGITALHSAGRTAEPGTDCRLIRTECCRYMFVVVAETYLLLLPLCFL